jgi:hypothetical protein
VTHASSQSLGAEKEMEELWINKLRAKADGKREEVDTPHFYNP